MFRIDVLEQRFHEVDRQENDYWSDLQTAVESLRSGFSNYLASDDRGGGTKQSKPRLSVGTVAADPSAVSDLENLPRDGRQLRFTLVLDLLETRRYQPNSFIVFNLSIERKSDSKLAIVDLDVSKPVGLNRGFISLYEYLYSRCVEKVGALPS
jgi:hypothetical protein